MGLFSVPFLSIISFSMTWGIGLIGAINKNSATAISSKYGILSNQLNMWITYGQNAVYMFLLPAQRKEKHG